jgi:hypothetical protein
VGRHTKTNNDKEVKTGQTGTNLLTTRQKSHTIIGSAMRKLEAGIAADEVTIFPLAILILPIRSKVFAAQIFFKKSASSSMSVLNLE